MYSNITVTLTPEQAAQLVKFCARQEKALNRRIARLNSQINGTYGEIYALDDLSRAVAAEHQRNVDNEYAY